MRHLRSVITEDAQRLLGNFSENGRCILRHSSEKGREIKRKSRDICNRVSSGIKRRYNRIRTHITSKIALYRGKRTQIPTVKQFKKQVDSTLDESKKIDREREVEEAAHESKEEL